MGPIVLLPLAHRPRLHPRSLLRLGSAWSCLRRRQWRRGSRGCRGWQRQWGRQGDLFTSCHTGGAQTGTYASGCLKKSRQWKISVVLDSALSRIRNESGSLTTPLVVRMPFLRTWKRVNLSVGSGIISDTAGKSCSEQSHPNISLFVPT